jgi:hypothetical protein
VLAGQRFTGAARFRGDPITGLCDDCCSAAPCAVRRAHAA